MPRTINQAGLDIIKQFEGCRLTAYQDEGGLWTVGFGHRGDVKFGMTLTLHQAETVLQYDLDAVTGRIDSAIPQTATSNQFSACVCLAFNVGPGAFRGSHLAALFQAGDVAGAAEQFLLWDHVNGVVSPGLLRRRQAERALFLTPDAAETP